MKRPVSTRLLVVAGVLVALLLAGVASFYASGDPDGLTKVSEDQGFAQTEQEHQTIAGGGALVVRRRRASAEA